MARPSASQTKRQSKFVKTRTKANNKSKLSSAFPKLQSESLQELKVIGKKVELTVAGRERIDPEVHRAVTESVRGLFPSSGLAGPGVLLYHFRLAQRYYNIIAVLQYQSATTVHYTDDAST
jgi:hypothetical protein